MICACMKRALFEFFYFNKQKYSKQQKNLIRKGENQ